MLSAGGIAVGSQLYCTHEAKAFEAFIDGSQHVTAKVRSWAPAWPTIIAWLMARKAVVAILPAVVHHLRAVGQHVQTRHIGAHRNA